MPLAGPQNPRVVSVGQQLLGLLQILLPDHVEAVAARTAAASVEEILLHGRVVAVVARTAAASVEEILLHGRVAAVAAHTAAASVEGVVGVAFREVLSRSFVEAHFLLVVVEVLLGVAVVRCHNGAGLQEGELAGRIPQVSVLVW